MKILRRLYRRYILFPYQKIRYGASEKDVWNLDVGIAHFILPRLKMLQKREPTRFYDPEWATDLQKMIDCFEFMCGDGYWQVLDEQELEDKINPGLKILAERFTQLWT